MTDEQRLAQARTLVAESLAACHPRGMTAGQMLHYLGTGLDAAGLRRVLERMLAEGVIETRLVPARPHGPQDPMVEYRSRRR